MVLSKNQHCYLLGNNYSTLIHVNKGRHIAISRNVIVCLFFNKNLVLKEKRCDSSENFFLCKEQIELLKKSATRNENCNFSDLISVFSPNEKTFIDIECLYDSMYISASIHQDSHYRLIIEGNDRRIASNKASDGRYQN